MWSYFRVCWFAVLTFTLCFNLIIRRCGRSSMFFSKQFYLKGVSENKVFWQKFTKSSSSGEGNAKRRKLNERRINWIGGKYLFRKKKSELVLFVESNISDMPYSAKIYRKSEEQSAFRRHCEESYTQEFQPPWNRSRKARKSVCITKALWFVSSVDNFCRISRSRTRLHLPAC